MTAWVQKSDIADARLVQEMKCNVEVLCACMKFWVMCDYNSCLII